MLRSPRTNALCSHAPLKLGLPLSIDGQDGGASAVSSRPLVVQRHHLVNILFLCNRLAVLVQFSHTSPQPIQVFLLSAVSALAVSFIPASQPALALSAQQASARPCSQSCCGCFTGCVERKRYVWRLLRRSASRVAGASHIRAIGSACALCAKVGCGPGSSVA